MVYHYAVAGTVDRSGEVGIRYPWTPVLRGGEVAFP
jgi:hypothetical protein